MTAVRLAVCFAVYGKFGTQPWLGDLQAQNRVRRMTGMIEGNWKGRRLHLAGDRNRLRLMHDDEGGRNAYLVRTQIS